MAGVDAINLVFRDPPGPDSSLVEIETDDGQSVIAGRWQKRGDGYHVLRITAEEIRRLPVPEITRRDD